MKARPICLSFDNGKSLVHVPLSRRGEQEAVIEQDDYQRLISAGVSPNWHTVGGSVTARTPKGQRLLGRIILGAEEGQTVRYQDGNPLNLRRDNLYLRYGGFSINSDTA